MSTVALFIKKLLYPDPVTVVLVIELTESNVGIADD